MINVSKEIFISSNYDFFNNCTATHYNDGDIILIDVLISGADDFNVPRLVLNQFRWLDCIIQSKVIKIVIFQKSLEGGMYVFLYACM